MSTNLPAHPMRRALNWGATGREMTEALPGDDLLPDGRSITNALDISAPPGDVWPWIAQIGRGRAGFYTYTWIENLLGADIHNLDHIDPALQHLQQGERIWLTPPRYLGKSGQFWTVKTVDPMRAFVLEQRPPDNPTTGTWALVLQPRDGATRLLNRHRDRPPHTFSMRAWTTIMMAGNLVMERKMLKTIAKRSAPPASQLSTFRSAEGKRLYLDAYRQVLEEWPVPFEELMVPTAFGDTHVPVSGAPGAAPVVLLHATGTSATGWLKNVGSLSQHHRVFAVDIIGEAGRSRQHALLRDRHALQ
jgi:hypothetical protein